VLKINLKLIKPRILTIKNQEFYCECG